MFKRGKKRRERGSGLRLHLGLKGDSINTDTLRTFIESISDHTTWDIQDEIAKQTERVLNGELKSSLPAVLVSSGHAIGKSYTLARLILMLALKYQGLVCGVFMPTAEQGGDQLFGDIKECAEEMQKHMSDIEIQARSIRIGKSKIVTRAIERKSGGTVSVQGYHGKWVLMVVDEAAYFGRGLIDALHSCGANEKSCILLAGNPMHPSDALYYAQGLAHKDCIFKVSSEWHPNVIQRKEIIPGAVSYQYCVSKIDAECSAYRLKDGEKAGSLIRGSIVEQDGDAGCLVDLSIDTMKFKKGQWVVASAEACQRVFGLTVAQISNSAILHPSTFDNTRSVDEFYLSLRNYDVAHVNVGIDVARDGKDSGSFVITYVVGHQVHVAKLAEIKKGKTIDYLREFSRIVRALHDNGVLSMMVNIDDTGGYGAGLVDALTDIAKKNVKYVNTIQNEDVVWFVENQENILFSMYGFSFARKCSDAILQKRFKTRSSYIADRMRSLTTSKRVVSYGPSPKDIRGALARKAVTRGNKYGLQPKKEHIKQSQDGCSPDFFDGFLMSIESYVSSDILTRREYQAQIQRRKDAAVVRMVERNPKKAAKHKSVSEMKNRPSTGRRVRRARSI